MIEIITPGAVGILCLFAFLRIRGVIRAIKEDDRFESNRHT